MMPPNMPCRAATRRVPLNMARMTMANLINRARFCSVCNGIASLRRWESWLPSRKKKNRRYNIRKKLMIIRAVP
jgi:hypothetical protein